MLFLSPVYTSVPYGLLWWISAPSQPNQYWQCPSNGSDVWFWWRFYLPWELELTGDFWWELNNTYAIEQFPSTWKRHDPHWKLTELLWTLSLIWQIGKEQMNHCFLSSPPGFVTLLLFRALPVLWWLYARLSLSKGGWILWCPPGFLLVCRAYCSASTFTQHMHCNEEAGSRQNQKDKNIVLLWCKVVYNDGRRTAQSRKP